MGVMVKLSPAGEPPPRVVYRWDQDTDILSARVETGGASSRRTGSIDVEGSDGSWLVLDVAEGEIDGVEVAVWPSVRRRTTLNPPQEIEDVTATFAVGAAREAALEFDVALVAEADRPERTIHFLVGPGRPTKTVRIASQILLDVDRRNRLAGLWLLDVPPFPDQP
jgi:hypothetical protein